MISIKHKKLQDALAIGGIAGVKILQILAKFIVTKAIAISIGPAGITFLSIFQNSNDIAKLFFTFGVSESGVPYYARKSAKKAICEFGRQYLYFLIIYLICGTALALLLSWGNDKFDARPLGSEIEILVVSAIFWSMAELNMMFLRARMNISYLNYAQIISAALIAIVAVATVGDMPTEKLGWIVLMNGLFLFSATFYFVMLYSYKLASGKLRSSILRGFTSARRILLLQRKIWIEMIRPGGAIFIILVSGLVTELTLRTLVHSSASAYISGAYNAGLIIVSGYFGIFLSAMLVEYFPKIAKADSENIVALLNDNLDLGISLAAPLLMLLIMFSDTVILILFSAEFLLAAEFARVAFLGALVLVVSNPIDLYLVCQKEFRFLIPFAVFYRIAQLVISFFFFNYYGLIGLGIASVLVSCIHLGGVYFYARQKHNLKINKAVSFRFYKAFIFIMLGIVISYAFGATVSLAAQMLIFGILIFDLINFFRNKVGYRL